ncbi:hypothetical protein BZA05DRAFT_246998 [Tricharina praecox]|uniref:uncharacterized protein n=1 Tax=Tricharina praecox TaxID=43433 RepID=UPI002220BA4B|nr:uncharacterized protein BZA05DRAFT_246998 [Tricharina praecox]KAI5854658.1 hypothetical protein BZA05DRAFT_246998 [Tricharina praecox]
MPEIQTHPPIQPQPSIHSSDVYIVAMVVVVVVAASSFSLRLLACMSHISWARPTTTTSNIHPRSWNPSGSMEFGGTRASLRHSFSGSLGGSLRSGNPSQGCDWNKRGVRGWPGWAVGSGGRGRGGLGLDLTLREKSKESDVYLLEQGRALGRSARKL